MFWKRKNSLKSKTLPIIFGSPESGKCHYPWDNLKPCPCNCEEKPLLMYEKDKLYYCGGTTENVFAVLNKKTNGNNSCHDVLWIKKKDTMFKSKILL